MSIKLRPKLFLAILVSSLVLAGAFAPTVSASNSKKISCHGQGATITKKYFLFADWCGDNNKTTIYRCNRNGTNISGCKSITEGKKGKFRHANVLEHKWGSNYFWIFDEGNAANSKKHVKKWCYDLNGNEATSESSCGYIPANNKSNSSCPGSRLKQGYTYYSGYFIKGCSNGNKILIKKNGKTKKTLSIGGGNELEDVMVNGDTGKIYYTTSGGKMVRLYKYSGDYKLPTSSGSSSGSSGDESGSSADYDLDDDTPAVAYGPTAKHTTPHNDGSIETTFFGNLKDEGDGCGIYTIINFVIDILTWGIGIAAIIGVMISGILYLTAKGNEEQLTKSKRRIYEIAIGVAIYAVLYAGLNFLLPGGKLNPSKECKQATTSNLLHETKNIQTNIHQLSTISKQSTPNTNSKDI